MVRMVLFMILAAFGNVGQFVAVSAPDNLKKVPSQEEGAAPSLNAGDPAPALQATKWLQGDAVRTFAPDNFYVVEFWSTACGALHYFMPQLSELQTRYRDQGVTIISFTSRDIQGMPNNTEDEVAAFVKQHRPPLSHTFAYAEDGTTAEAWLKAAGQKGFCTFVVDGAGRIAYIGHPMFLDLVLSKVVAGETAKTVSEDMAKVVAEYIDMHEGLARDFQAGRELKAGLRALKAFEEKYPLLADIPPLIQAKLSLLPKHGDPGEGKEYAEALVAKAIQRKDVAVLGQAYSILRDQKESQELLALAMKAAEAHVRIDGGRDPQSLLNLGEAYLVSGDMGKSKEHARRALEAATKESATFQEYVEQEARRLGAEK